MFSRTPQSGTLLFCPKRACRAAAAVLAVLTASSAMAEQQQLSANSLVDLSLEQLADIQVTSVSRRAERLADAPASVYVITSEDIRRSGATSLPEALRLAPNLQVARADANQYAITARGFNSTLANKMLVMIDGRTVYSPLFSGTFWEAQDVMLEDVERIEVMSGAGGTLWGTNAMNGVINVITRSAHETQGGLASLGGGNRLKEGAARYGGAVGSDGHLRVYGKQTDRGNSTLVNGSPVRDASDMTQGGFRSDWGGTRQSFTLQGDAYSSDIDQTPGTRQVSGANLLGRWNRVLEGGSSLRVQTYYDRTERDQPGAIRETLDTFDVDVQHAVRLAASHEVVWGGGYRYAPDKVENLSPAVLGLSPADRTLRWANVFVQDDINLTRTLDLTLGLRLEDNYYTGIEPLPNVRLAYKPSSERLVWASASRAVRAPARIDRDFYQTGAVQTNTTFESEVANVYELGYRAQPTAALSYSVTVFHHDFDRLRSIEPAAGGAVFDNRMEGRTDGFETWGSYRVTRDWRLSGGLSVLRERFRLQSDSASIGGTSSLGNDPSNWWSLRSTYNLGSDWELDAIARHVGALPNPAVPAYTAVDARIGWRVRRDLDLSLLAQNLFDPKHPEWGVAGQRAQFERGVFLKATWRP